MARGYYRLKHGAGWRFTLHAGNHEVILTSQSYELKAGAEGGIASVRSNGPDTDRYDTRTSAANEPYFVLKSSHGQVIGTSEMYSSEAARDEGIAAVRANSSSTVVLEG